MQSHKNQVHRLILIDRVLQQNTYKHPGGVTREALEISVQSLLSSPEGQILTNQNFHRLWKGNDAFRKDLKFILTHYPRVLVKEGNKLWRYRDIGSTIFPRFGSVIADSQIRDLILLLDYVKGLPLAKDAGVEHCIEVLENWFGYTSANTSTPVRHLHHQFSTEDGEAFSKNQVISLHESLGQHIVELQYTSSRDNQIRHLEFHPWEFRQSESRWYVAGYISHDIAGNYPDEGTRSNYPGLVLKLSQIDKVNPLSVKERNRRKQEGLHSDRFTFVPRDKYPSILDFNNRIGIGGWEQTLINLKMQERFAIKFRLTAKAYRYYESSDLVAYTKEAQNNATNGWLNLQILIDQRKKNRTPGALSTVNRELLDALRSYGDQIEIFEPAELREKLRKEAMKLAQFYATDINQ